MKATMTFPKELHSLLQEMAQKAVDVDAAAARALEAGADVAVEGIRARVVKEGLVDKGTLLSTMKKGPIKKEGNEISIVVGQLPDRGNTPAREAIKANVYEYGAATGMGARDRRKGAVKRKTTIAARPFLRPTMMEDRAKIRRAMMDSLESEEFL